MNIDTNLWNDIISFPEERKSDDNNFVYKTYVLKTL